jgi:hypothetical protein
LTVAPLRPDLSLPFFISRISVSTFLPAEGEYFRPEDFFLGDDFFALMPVPLLVSRGDFFFEAFFVAMPILPRKSDVRGIRVSCTAGGVLENNGRSFASVAAAPPQRMEI